MGQWALSVVCPACNAKIKRGRTRCLRCGEPLPDIDAGAAKRSRFTLGLVAGSFVLIVAALFALVGRSAPSDPLSLSPTTARPERSEEPAPVPPHPPRAVAPRTGPPPFADEAMAATWEYDRGDLDAALRKFRDAVRRNPRDAESLSNLGQVLVRLGRALEAIPLLQRAIELNPDRWAYRFNLARAFGELGQWDQAVAHYRAAAGLFPDDYATLFNLARALHKQGDEQAALQEYQKAIAARPEDPSFHIALALSYERLNRRTDAAAAYAQYLELAPDAPEAERVRGRIAQLLPPRTARAGPAPPPPSASAPR